MSMEWIKLLLSGYGIIVCTLFSIAYKDGSFYIKYISDKITHLSFNCITVSLGAYFSISILQDYLLSILGLSGEQLTLILLYCGNAMNFWLVVIPIAILTFLINIFCINLAHNKENNKTSQ